jgi:peptidase U49-like protein
VTPIRELDADLIDSVARIAPEKSDNFNDLRLKYDPCAVFTNDKKFSFRVNTESKEIKLPTVALEYLWCACYAFYVLYQEYRAANQSDEIHFDANGTHRSRTAMSVYRWGVEQIGHSPSEVWPPDLPRPAADTPNGNEDIAVANELYLCSASWIIHHELAHIYCGHNNEPVNDEESRAQEQEADDSATKWILEGVSDAAVLQKRGLGVVIAVIVITTQDILAGELKETTHPRSFQRLYNVLDKHFHDADHLVYVFSVVIFHLNMAIAGMDIEKDDAETWKANLETCLVQFSRLTRP